MWSVDGERIVFQANRDGTPRIYWQRADGSDAAVPLTKTSGGAAEIPNAWSADGKILMYTTAKDSAYALWTVNVADGTAQPFGDVRSIYPLTPAISPDGRWVAYGQWAGAGDGGIYIEPVPRTGAKYQLSSGVGIHPMWSRDGKHILYAPPGNAIMDVPVTTQPFALGNPVERPRHSVNVLGPSVERRYDYTADGRILGIFPGGEAAETPERQYTVVLNWFDVLKARVTATASGRER
jgi:dipeptidyl aminopeptidase/acylaminoacyl peptidase